MHKNLNFKAIHEDPYYNVDGESHDKDINMGADDDCGKHVEADAVRSLVLDDTRYAQGSHWSISEQPIVWEDMKIGDLKYVVQNQKCFLPFLWETLKKS